MCTFWDARFRYYFNGRRIVFRACSPPLCVAHIHSTLSVSSVSLMHLLWCRTMIFIFYWCFVCMYSKTYDSVEHAVIKLTRCVILWVSVRPQPNQLHNDTTNGNCNGMIYKMMLQMFFLFLFRSFRLFFFSFKLS